MDGENANIGKQRAERVKAELVRFGADASTINTTGKPGNGLALCGAIYLDGGYPAAAKFIEHVCSDGIDRIADEPLEVNPKGQLQEILQAISSSSPSYELISQEGPDHLKTFTTAVMWEGKNLGEGTGHSKKEAEIAAAVDALNKKSWKAKA